MKDDEARKAVREGYGKIARQGGSCCGPATPCCSGTDLARDVSRGIGYSEEEMQAVPDGANMGLGCGNPVALASLREGDVVLDLGAGGGFDCFLAANRVGKTGRVIGVDMTPEMIGKARENARQGGYDNVEFRLGEMENLPAADGSVDVVISNCVINLVPDKRRAFQETFRVLRPGGRLMVSDIVLLGELPDAVRSSVQAYVGCLAGAELKDDYLRAIEDAGFRDVTIVDDGNYPIKYMANDVAGEALRESVGMSKEEMDRIAGSILSIKVSAIKPGGCSSHRCGCCS
jgi:SAM-dependent methyltransferase